MQSRAIRRLARKLRSTHRRTKSWYETAQEHNIINAKGKVNKILAWQIAVNDFEPTEHDTLLRIGMPCECDECRKAKRMTRRAAHQTLFEMNKEQLIEALQNRKPMPKPNYSKKAMNDFLRACRRGAQRVSTS